VTEGSFAQYSESLLGAKNTLEPQKKETGKDRTRENRNRDRGQGLDAAIDAYMKVYLSSWKRPELYQQFIPGLIRICAAMGALRLGIIYVDGEPAAAQLGSFTRKRVDLQARLRRTFRGLLRRHHSLRHALPACSGVDKVTEVDYLSGDDAYKKDWMSQRRERGILALNPRTPRGVLAIARHVGGRAVKRAALSFASPFRRGKSRNSIV